jgi:hypothetical protein
MIDADVLVAPDGSITVLFAASGPSPSAPPGPLS